MKKISILVATIFLCFGLAANVTALEEESESTDYEFPVMWDIPPKSEEILEIMDPDPEPTMSFDDLPSQFSWLSYGGNWMTIAKAQGNCGSCWAFGSLGALEAAINIAKGDPDFDLDLSEQYVLACLSAAGSCSGGWMSEAIAYIQSSSPGPTGNGINGVPKESCLPYQGVDYIPCDSKCDDWDYFTDPPQEDNMLWQIKDFGVTTGSEDDPSYWNLMKTWVITHGPIIVDIYTGGWGSYWWSHHSSTDVYENDDSGITNHAQVLCGWVDDPDILNGGYWIIKNSWGPSFGYGGFSNIAYGCNSLGTRDVTWVESMEWPSGGTGGGGKRPVDVDLGVFSDFDYSTDEGTKYPNLGDEIEFTDTSDGDVAYRQWDFDGDGVGDSNKKNPTHVYTKEGEYEVSLTVWNEWGLNSTRTKIVEVREIWPPVAIISPEEYVDNEIEVRFDGRYSHDPDGAGIVSYHWDFDDGTTSSEINPLHTFPEPDRIYEVVLTVTDTDGISGSETSIVKIDQNVPPETTINHGFGDGGTKWYSSTQRISFTATDWTGVIETYYRIDGGEWILYEPEEQKYIPIGDEGMHTVEAYSIDYYHNEEDPKSDTFGIDKTVPTLDVSINGVKKNDWYTSAVTTSISGDDDLSGFDKIIYKLDSSGWAEYSGSISVGEGQHSLWAVGVDNAGNTVEEIADINIDMGSPSTSVIFDGEGSKGMYYKNVDVRLASSDAGAGVDKIYYRIDGGSFSEYDGFSLAVNTIGKHKVDFYAVDNIGNEESQKTTSFTILPVNFIFELDRPSNNLYIFGMQLFGTSQPIIIGNIDVIANVESFTSNPADVEYVEFLIDGNSKMIDSEAPFAWRLDEQLFGSHTISVKAASSDGESVTETVNAMCIII